MDLSAEVDKLTCETAALRNEIWELKELVNRQNERIIYMLQRQNDMLTGLVAGKTIFAADKYKIQEVTTDIVKEVTATKTTASKETPKRDKDMAKCSKETTKSAKKSIKIEPKIAAKEITQKPTKMETTESETYNTNMDLTTFEAADDNSDSNSDSDDFKAYGVESHFPMRTQQELEQVERKINETSCSEYIDTMKTLLRPQGLVKGLTHIFTVDLIMEYNIDGLKNKKRLLDYPKILNALYKATKKANYTQDEFIEDMRKGLQVAKRRYIKRRSVQNKKKREKEEIDDIFS